MRLARAAACWTLLAAALVTGTAGAAGPSVDPSADPGWRIDGRWAQGELLRGEVPAGSRVEFKGRPVFVDESGLFVIGLDRDEPATVELRVTTPDGHASVRTPAVSARRYSIQRLDGLPPDKVNPPPDVSARIERESAQVRAARETLSARRDFLHGFIWPCTGRISGVYGSQRILNGVPKQPHYGVDVAVPTGTRVIAPAGGVVVLAERDLYYTGGTLMIDHGHGLVSAFLHLSRLDVAVGDRVEQAQPIALSGATGRATGPHLDWRISWIESRIDPQRLVPPMPGTAAAQSRPSQAPAARPH